MKESNDLKQEYLRKELSKYSYNNPKKRLSEIQKCIEFIDTLFEIDQELQNFQTIDNDLEKETTIYNNNKDLLSRKQKIISDYEKCYTCPSCKKTLKLNSKQIQTNSNTTTKYCIQKI